MNKQTLIPALALATLTAATLALPATASADSFKHKETTVVRGDHMRDGNVRRVHDGERRYRHGQQHGPSRRAAAPHRHNHGHHYGHQHRHPPRHDHGPVVRYEPRADYRVVERYEPRYDDNIRVRISYDLHL